MQHCCILIETKADPNNSPETPAIKMQLISALRLHHLDPMLRVAPQFSNGRKSTRSSPATTSKHSNLI
jgi:hypothetical protein